MKRRNCLFLILSLIVMIFMTDVSLAADSHLKEETEVNILLEKGTVPKKKVPIYTPKKAEQIKILPQTGEIITAFIYVILGLSVVLFLLGLVVIKMNSNQLSWEY